MRARPRALLIRVAVIALLSANLRTAAAAAPPPPPPAPSRAAEDGFTEERPFRLWNAYGDTVWFESSRLHVGRRAYIFKRMTVTDTLTFVIPRLNTPGSAIAIVARSPFDALPADSLLGRILAIRPRLRSSMLVDGMHPIIWIEPGRLLGEFGWDLSADARLDGRLRMLFVVFGRPDSSAESAVLRDRSHEAWAHHRTALDPVPLLAGVRPRVYDVTTAEMTATARVVGDVVVDFGRRTVTRYSESDVARGSERGREVATDRDTSCACVGRVLDAADGRPLPGAWVTVARTDRGVRTDSLGAATVRGVECWSWVVEGLATGYEPDSRMLHFRPRATDTLEFRLRRFVAPPAWEPERPLIEHR